MRIQGAYTPSPEARSLLSTEGSIPETKALDLEVLLDIQNYGVDIGGPF